MQKQQASYILQFTQIQQTNGQQCIGVSKIRTNQYFPKESELILISENILSFKIPCLKSANLKQEFNLVSIKNSSQLESQKQYLIQSQDRQMSQVFFNVQQNNTYAPIFDSQSARNLNQNETEEKQHSGDMNISIHEQGLPDDQNFQKKNENKQKYRRLRQKLASMSYQHQQPFLMSDLKEVTSPNKSRILKLAIQLEKLTQTQNREYTSIENVLRQLQKILQHRRQHDLLVLRQSKFIPTVSIIFKTIPALHKNQLLQSLKTLWMSLRILRYLSSLGSNRNYLILTNQLTVLNTLLSCLLGKQQRKVGLQCLTVLNQILGSSISLQAQPIVSTTLQLSFCSQLLKKIKVNLESCIGQDGLSDEEFMLSSLSYLFNILKRYFQRQIGQPIDEVDETPQQGQIDSLTSFLLQLLTEILYQKDGKEGVTLREQELPTCVVNICLYILKILNIIFHVSLSSSQKNFEAQTNSNLIKALNYLLTYSKQNLKESQQLKSICNEMMIFLGNCCLSNKYNQNTIRKGKLLENLYNHDMQYLMEPLKNVYIPSLCCVLYDNKENIAETFIENSPLTVMNYLKKETQKISIGEEDQKNVVNLNGNGDFKKSRTLSRTGSMSSLTSCKSYTTQQSHNIVIGNIARAHKKQKGLCLRFPHKYWKYLEEQLNEFDG